MGETADLEPEVAFTRRWARVMASSVLLVSTANASLLWSEGSLASSVGVALGCAAVAGVWGWWLAGRHPTAAIGGLAVVSSVAIAVVHVLDPSGDSAVYYALPAALFAAGPLSLRGAAAIYTLFGVVIAAAMALRPFPDPYWSTHVTDAVLILVVGAWASLRQRARASQEAARLRELAAALESSNLTKTRFLASMSHELRTPLNAVIGYAELLREELAGRHASDLGRIEAAGRHLLGLIDDVLDIARVDSGGRRPEPEDVELRAVLDEVGGWVAAEAERRGVQLGLLVEGPGHARLDRTMLRQILVNLVNNALRHADGTRVDVVLSGDAATLRVEVTDDGIGIPAAEHERIFAPFHQLGRAGRPASGTGLGLALVARFVAALGGQVAVRSEPGQGARFVVTLPRVAG